MSRERTWLVSLAVISLIYSFAIQLRPNNLGYDSRFFVATSLGWAIGIFFIPAVIPFSVWLFCRLIKRPIRFPFVTWLLIGIFCAAMQMYDAGLIGDSHAR